MHKIIWKKFINFNIFHLRKTLFRPSVLHHAFSCVMHFFYKKQLNLKIMNPCFKTFIYNRQKKSHDFFLLKSYKQPKNKFVKPRELIIQNDLSQIGILKQHILYIGFSIMKKNLHGTKKVFLFPDFIYILWWNIYETKDEIQKMIWVWQ